MKHQKRETTKQGDADLNILRIKENRFKEKLIAKRLLLGKSDGAMESQCPSGRFELESDINILEIMLAEIRQEIAGLSSLKSAR